MVTTVTTVRQNGVWTITATFPDGTVTVRHALTRGATDTARDELSTMRTA